MSKRRIQEQINSEIKAKKRDLYVMIGLIACIVAVIFLIYGKTSNYDFVIDDKIMIVDNQYVNKGMSGYWSLFSAALNGDTSTPGVTRPITMLSHAIDVEIFGLDPGPHHVINVILYAVLSVLIFALLRKYLLKNESVILAFIIVVLFISHPVHVETVANIKGRDDILCFIFGLLSLFAYFKYLKSNNFVFLVFGLLSLIASFFCKETGVVFAVMIPMTHFFYGDQKFKSVLIQSVPFLITGASLVILWFVLFSTESGEINDYNNSLVAFDSYTKRYLMTLRILLHYLVLLFYPHPLSWDYSLGFFDYSDSTLLLSIISVIVYCSLLLWCVKNISQKSMISYGILFFLLFLFPVSNLMLLIPATFGERFLFIPSFGLIVAVVFAIRELFKKWKKNRPGLDYTIYIPIVGMALLLIFTSSARVNYWQNEGTLIPHDYHYAKTLRGSRSYVQHLTGLQNNKKQNHQLALNVCMDALQKFPEDWQLWYFKGVIERFFQQHQRAKISFRQSLTYNDKNFYALVNYGNLLVNENPIEAIELFKKAVLIEPKSPKILGNIGILLHRQGQLIEARSFYEKSLSIEPNNQKFRDAFDLIRSE